MSEKGHKYTEKERESKRDYWDSIKGKHVSAKTEFKKGMKAWNFKDGKRLKRKYKRFNGKLMLNAHVVWLKYNNLKKIPKGYVIHHKDGDSLNDSIHNIILMEDIEHRKLHNRKVGDDLIHSPQETKIKTGDSGFESHPKDTPEDAIGTKTSGTSGKTDCTNCMHKKKSHGHNGCCLHVGKDTNNKLCPCKEYTIDKTDCTNCEELRLSVQKWANKFYDMQVRYSNLKKKKGLK